MSANIESSDGQCCDSVAPCDFNCLLSYMPDEEDPKIVPRESDSEEPANFVDDIYQVLGKDVLRSSLLDDIDLYLECEDDSVYKVPLRKRDLDTTEANSIQITIVAPDSGVENAPRFACEICKKSFTRTSLLRDHLAQQHGVNDLFPCPVCKYKGQLCRHLQKHIKRKHSDFDWSTFVKKVEVPTEGISNTNRDKASQPADLENELHDLLPVDSNGIQTVVSCLASSDQNVRLASEKCNNLPVTTSSNSSNIQQISVCSIIEPATDDSSSSSIMDCIGLELTVQTEPNSPNPRIIQQSWTCEICTKLFKQERSFISHMRQHSGQLDFKCDICTKKFADSNALRSHKATHSVIRFNSCTATGCQKTFKTSSALNQHKIVVHGEKIHCCTFVGCSKSYAMAKDLKAHLKSHTLQYECSWDGCGKKFRDLCNLKSHTKIHTGVKDISCPHCTYECAQKTSLNYHIRKYHAIM